jgi:hypothetical protein
MQLLGIGLNRTFNAVVARSNRARPTNYTKLNQAVTVIRQLLFFMPAILLREIYATYLFNCFA